MPCTDITMSVESEKYHFNPHKYTCVKNKEMSASSGEQGSIYFPGLKNICTNDLRTHVSV